MILLDAAATTPVRRTALEAAWPYLTGAFGNPSSVHEPGLAAARGLADARADVAGFLGCRASELVFTSGGTESANLCIKGLALGALGASAASASMPDIAAPLRRIVTTRIEHEAVLASVDYLARVHGFEVAFAETDASGRVTPAALRAALDDSAGSQPALPGTTLVTVGWANNEVGTVQDVAALASVAHEFGALFHTDAVQAAAHLPIDVRALGVDALSLSGHKLGAPKGSGAAFVRAGAPFEPLLHGGGQERGRRSGTENVAWAVALAAAVRELPADRVAGDAPLSDTARDDFIVRVLASVPGARLTGSATERLPGHASFVLPGVNGESVLLELERRGVIASSGSACAAGRTEPSHVLTALGLTTDEASAALRFTWATDVSAADLEESAAALTAAVATLRAV